MFLLPLRWHQMWISFWHKHWFFFFCSDSLILNTHSWESWVEPDGFLTLTTQPWKGKLHTHIHSSFLWLILNSHHWETVFIRNLPVSPGGQLGLQSSETGLWRIRFGICYESLGITWVRRWWCNRGKCNMSDNYFSDNLSLNASRSCCSSASCRWMYGRSAALRLHTHSRPITTNSTLKKKKKKAETFDSHLSSGLCLENFALGFRTWITNPNLPPRFDFLHTGNIHIFFSSSLRGCIKKHLCYFWFKFLA